MRKKTLYTVSELLKLSEFKRKKPKLMSNTPFKPIADFELLVRKGVHPRQPNQI